MHELAVVLLSSQIVLIGSRVYLAGIQVRGPYVYGFRTLAWPSPALCLDGEIARLLQFVLRLISATLDCRVLPFGK